MRSPLRSYRPAPINPSTSASISNCSTASATARRKSPSPAFSSSSANANLSSVIGSSPALQVKVLQLHLSRSAPMTTSNSPAARHCGSAQNSTTSVDANSANRLCHGDFHPINVLGEISRPVVIDWPDACGGDPAADVCRSYLLLRLHAADIAEPYLDAYCRISNVTWEKVLD